MAFVIEFRNGNFLGHQEVRSVPLRLARRFGSRKKARRETEQWLIAGGMVTTVAGQQRRAAALAAEDL